jgi:hypothetical protein
MKKDFLKSISKMPELEKFYFKYKPEVMKGKKMDSFFKGFEKKAGIFGRSIVKQVSNPVGKATRKFQSPAAAEARERSADLVGKTMNQAPKPTENPYAQFQYKPPKTIFHDAAQSNILPAFQN